MKGITLESKVPLIAVTTAIWALLGWGIVAAYCLSHGKFGFLEGFLGFAGGAIGGLLWSLTMWHIFAKPRLEKLVKDENKGAEVIK